MTQEVFDRLWQEYYSSVYGSIQETQAKADSLGATVEPGYEAYMTGVILGGLTMAKHIGKETGLDIIELNEFTAKIIGVSTGHSAITGDDDGK